MTVSSEHRGRRVATPDVVGLVLHDAIAVLRNVGIDNFRVRYTETYAEEHAVVVQEPRGGLLIERERAMILSVCRRNLVHYLPQVYQQSAPEGSFLRGFLYVVQQMSDSVASHVDHIHELFDPRTARDDFLPWLGSWLSITLSPDWDELQRRKMLLAATQLFPYRGTAHAIREFVRIYTSANVEVEENVWPYTGFRVGVASAVGLDTVILPPMNLAHCFVVRLDRAAADVSDEEIIKIHQIIQLQKPAHTSYFLAFADETDGGAMAVFVEIGRGSIGVGGVGVGQVEAEVVGESEPERVPESKAKRSTKKPRAKEQPAADSTSREASEPAKAESASPKTEAKQSKSGRTAKSGTARKGKPAPPVDEKAGAEAKAKQEGRRNRAAEATAAREARKARASARAAERSERSQTQLKAVSEEDLAEAEAAQEAAPSPKAVKSKTKAKASDTKSKAKTKAPGKTGVKKAGSKAKASTASSGGAESEPTAKRVTGRTRAADAAAARQKRKDAAAARAAVRKSKAGESSKTGTKAPAAAKSTGKSKAKSSAKKSSSKKK